jgi:NAD(P)-dependent dehydrogenase (short-subunit alcohol dehydrogenase family)
MKLSGASVVVTGGGNGIGAALARRFTDEGARGVVIADVDERGLDAVAHETGAHRVRCDVTKPDEIAALVDEAERTFGPIDLFCSNAGVVVPGGVETTDDVWQTVMDINVMAHVWATRILVPRMIERGGGYLLHTASAAGLLTQIGSVTYSVSKHAVVALAEWLSITYGEQGIKVSVLCPQAVRTNMTAGTDNGGVAGVDGMLEPEDVAAAVVEGLAAERFLILPHGEVLEYFRRKGSDYDRWLAGMRRLQGRFRGGGF